jgi:hypothetical protein
MDIGVLRLLLKRAKTWTLVADDVKLFPKQPRTIPKIGRGEWIRTTDLLVPNQAL